jgi:hypothetical protein
MQFPLERGQGGFVKMYDEAHRGFDKQNLRGCAKLGFNLNNNLSN